MKKLGRDLITEDYKFKIDDLDYYFVRNSYLLFGTINYYYESDVDAIIDFVNYNPEAQIFSYDIQLIQLLNQYDIEVYYCEKQVSQNNIIQYIDNVGRSIENNLLLPSYVHMTNLSVNLIQNYNIIPLGGI